MGSARAIAGGETVLAAVEEASPPRAFEAMTSTEVER